jgi:multidrug resistance efflux pump
MTQLPLRKIIICVVALLALVLGYSLWHYYMASPWTRDGRVRADVIQIAPDVSGFLTEVDIKDDQLVHAGDTLLVIDRARYELCVEARTGGYSQSQGTNGSGIA